MYITIDFDLRKKLNVTVSDLALVTFIYNLSTNPTAKIKGWCNMRKQVIADCFGMSKQGVMKQIAKMEQAGLLVKSEDGRLLQTSKFFNKCKLEFDSEVTNGKQSLPKQVNKVDSLGKQSLPDKVNKVDPLGKQSLPRSNSNIDNNTDSNIDKGKDCGTSSAPPGENPKSNLGEKDKKTFNIFAAFIDSYHNFLKEKNGVGVMWDKSTGSVEGKAIKQIIHKLKKAVTQKSKSENLSTEGEQFEKRILASWDYILAQWDQKDKSGNDLLEPFLRNKIKPSEINGNIDNILNQLRNGYAKKSINKVKPELAKANDPLHILKQD